RGCDRDWPRRRSLSPAREIAGPGISESPALSGRTCAGGWLSRLRWFDLAASHNPQHNAPVLDAPLEPVGSLAQELLGLTARICGSAEEDPFGNPVLLVALAISRRIGAGEL